MKSNKKIAVFILSNGRPNDVITYQTLKKHGYTGEIYIIVDDEDKTLREYKENFKDKIIVFSKKDYRSKFDMMDNFTGNKVIVYARNACYDIARKLGLDYFFEYEDDYVNLQYRWIEGGSLKGSQIKDLDKVLSLMVECLDETSAETIAFAQGGDFIGGAGSFKNNTFKRKAMNSFVFKVNQDPLKDTVFNGRMNDDVNTYLIKGKVGGLFFQIPNICLVQRETQSNLGGNTEVYKTFGTYAKSFYSVMAAPNCCKISLMGRINKRLHHLITWKNAVPRIIDEKYKKQ